jgi:hypothetical protein
VRDSKLGDVRSRARSKAVASQKLSRRWQVTNPPYSEDHVERILKFCVAAGKPWFLLVPNFVYVNPYYPKALGPAVKPCYLVPAGRYEYVVPPGVRRDEAVKTAPFGSFWYVHLQDATAAFVREWRAREARHSGAPGAGAPGAGAMLAGSLAQLPHTARAQYDPSRRRLRKKQREAYARRARVQEAKKEAARVALRASQPCRFGLACIRPGRWYAHPSSRGQEEN